METSVNNSKGVLLCHIAQESQDNYIMKLTYSDDFCPKCTDEKYAELSKRYDFELIGLYSIYTIDKIQLVHVIMKHDILLQHNGKWLYKNGDNIVEKEHFYMFINGLKDKIECLKVRDFILDNCFEIKK